MQVAGMRGIATKMASIMPDPNLWHFAPTFRIDEQDVQLGPPLKPRFSDNFRVWHTSCKAVGVTGTVPDHTKGDLQMTATTLSNRFAAAAFSLVVSATMLAYAIVPATPSLA
jgi:hypothetical protein